MLPENFFQPFFERIRYLIGEDHLKKAIKWLDLVLKDTPHENLGIAQSARYASIRQAVIAGTMDQERESCEMKGLRMAILELTDTVEAYLTETTHGNQKMKAWLQGTPFKFPIASKLPPLSGPNFHAEAGDNSILIQGDNSSVEQINDHSQTHHHYGLSERERAENGRKLIKSRIVEEISSLNGILWILETVPPVELNWLREKPAYGLVADHQVELRNQIRAYADSLERTIGKSNNLHQELNALQKDLKSRPELLVQLKKTVKDLIASREHLVRLVENTRKGISMVDQIHTRSIPGLGQSRPVIPQSEDLESTIFEVKKDLLFVCTDYALHTDNEKEREILFLSFFKEGNTNWYPGLEKDVSSEKGASKAFSRAFLEFNRMHTEKLQRILDQQSSRGREYKTIRVDEAWKAWRRFSGRPDKLVAGDRLMNETHRSEEEANDLSGNLNKLALSYGFGDATACEFYIEVLLKNEGIEPQMRTYLEWCQLRITQPDLFLEGIGVFVVKLEPEGSFAQSGIKVGDVICTMNGHPVLWVWQIAEKLATREGQHHMLTVLRKGPTIHDVQIAIPGGRSAGARLVPMMVYEAVQF